MFLLSILFIKVLAENILMYFWCFEFPNGLQKIFFDATSDLYILGIFRRAKMAEEVVKLKEETAMLRQTNSR